jgi:hypothetical protein
LRRERPDIGLSTSSSSPGLDLDDVYDGRKSWSDLRQDAGAPILAGGPHESTLRRAIGRHLHIDDTERISTYRRLLGRRTARRRRAPRA